MASFLMKFSTKFSDDVANDYNRIYWENMVGQLFYTVRLSFFKYSEYLITVTLKKKLLYFIIFFQVNSKVTHPIRGSFTMLEIVWIKWVTKVILFRNHYN